MMLQTMMKKESNMSFNMKGIGVSFIDNEPKEIFFVSVHKISFLIKKVIAYC